MKSAPSYACTFSHPLLVLSPSHPLSSCFSPMSRLFSFSVDDCLLQTSCEMFNPHGHVGVQGWDPHFRDEDSEAQSHRGMPTFCPLHHLPLLYLPFLFISILKVEPKVNCKVSGNLFKYFPDIVLFN